MAPVQVYLHWFSPPCRAVAMACKIADIEVEYHVINLFNGEHMKPEFLAINPDHCVPTIKDDGFNLWESRPITAYLLDKYAADHQLWPKDLQTRANIHRMMDFDMSVVFKTVGTYMFPRIFKNEESGSEEMEKMLTRLNDTVFHDKKYAVGDTLTLADLFIISSITFTEIVGYQVSADKFPNLVAWIQRVKGSDFYEPVNKEYEKAQQTLNEKRSQVENEGKAICEIMGQ